MNEIQEAMNTSPKLVMSARSGPAAEAFPSALSLYVRPGATVADVTHGNGAFWRRIPDSTYTVLASDSNTGTDCRNLPYDAGTIDCVVFDPPRMHDDDRAALRSEPAYEGYYRHHATDVTGAKHHEAAMQLHTDMAAEATRVLRENGVYILTCQDEICADCQRFSHIEITTRLSELGLLLEDLFVVVDEGTPVTSRRLRQLHARKNHAYLLVFVKKNPETKWKGLDKRFIPAELGQGQAPAGQLRFGEWGGE